MTPAVITVVLVVTAASWLWVPILLVIAGWARQHVASLFYRSPVSVVPEVLPE